MSCNALAWKRVDERIVDQAAKHAALPQPTGQSAAIALDPEDVVAGVLVPILRELRERDDGRNLRVRDLLDLRLDPVLQGAVQLLELDSQAPALEVRLDARLDLLQLERLGHVVRAAHGESLHLVEHLGVGADEDDRHLGQPRICLELCADLVAVELRHVDVEEDEIGRLATGGLERELSIGHGPDLVPALLEHSSQELQVGGRVVDDEDIGDRAHLPCLHSLHTHVFPSSGRRSSRSCW